MTTTTDTRHDVRTTLQYYDDPGDGTPPAPVIVGKATVTNERAMVEARAVIEDVRGREAAFTLDRHGFQYVRHASTAHGCVADGFHDEVQIVTAYFADCEQLLKDVTGATRVLIFDHKVRRGPAHWHRLGQGNSAQRGPLRRAHVDQSYGGAASLLRWFLPAEAHALMQRRWQIINVWRPIETVYKDPIGVAAAWSVPEEDLVEARAIYSDHERQTWTIKAGRDVGPADSPGSSPGLPTTAHRWYYLHAQAPDEPLLIKCFDSVDDGRIARRAAHSAFRDPAYDDAAARQSLEIRAFVFYAQ